jgi:hypothetical protein
MPAPSRTIPYQTHKACSFQSSHMQKGVLSNWSIFSKYPRNKAHQPSYSSVIDMLWESTAGPNAAHARTWERSNCLQSLERCGPKAVALYQYWNARRGIRPMPTRADIDPVEMRQWLPRLMLVDVGPNGQSFTFRLVGTQIVDLLGVNPTGRLLETAWPEEIADHIVDGCREVVETRQPVFSQQISGWLEDQKPTAWAMRLPLSSDGKDVDMILAYLSDNIGMLSQL